MTQILSTMIPPGSIFAFPTLVLTNGMPLAIVSIIAIENCSIVLPTKYNLAFPIISGINRRSTLVRKRTWRGPYLASNSLLADNTFS